MLSQYPLSHRVFVGSTLTFAWLFAAGAGLSATTLSAVANTVVRELGLVMTIVCGFLLGGASIWAATGVAFKHYRWEWGGAWVAALGISPYLVSLWAVVFSGDDSRLTQAELVTSLMLFFLTRAAMCGAHAAHLRAIHIEGEVVVNAVDDDLTAKRDDS